MVMDLKRVRYFVAVADHLHFRKAAEQMHVVQSAISQQVKQLEEELNLELFDRKNQETQLTEAGRLLLPECRRLLVQADAIMLTARQAATGMKGRVCFAMVDNAVSVFLPPLIREFSKRFPEVELDLRILDRTAQAEAIDNCQIDLGLMPVPPPGWEFDHEQFVGAPLLAALPLRHPLAKKPAVLMSDLVSEPFVLFPASLQTRLYEIVLISCGMASFFPHVVQEATQLHTLLALVDAGIGVTLVPEWVARMEFPGVAFRPTDPPSPVYALSFVWRRDSKNRVIERFRRVAHETEAERLGAQAAVAD